MKRFLCVLLLLTLVLSVACADNSPDDNDGTTAVPESESPEPAEDDLLKDDLPEYDFGQREFRTVVYERDFNNSKHFSDGLTGDVYPDSLWYRNQYIEERFNVKLVETLHDVNYCNSGVKNDIRAGDDVFDLVFPNDMNAYSFAQDRLIFNMADLPYVNLSKPYWDQSLLQYTTILGESYYAFNNYDITYYDHTHVLMYDKQLIEDFDLPNPNELVMSGNWTFDAMFEMMLTVTSGKDAGENAKYGYISLAKQVLPDFWIGGGEMLIKKDNDDVPYFAALGNERFNNLIEKVFVVMWDQGAWCNDNNSSGNIWSETENFFNAHRALFSDNTFALLEGFRNMDADFGILPFPKYDDIQTKYYSRVEAGCKVGVVPITNKDPEGTSLLMEALACASANIVLPKYYDVALKVKNVRDEDSSEMIDFIFENKVYDLGDTWWCSTLRDGLFKPMFQNNNRAIASTLTKYETVVNVTLIGNLLKAFS